MLLAVSPVESRPILASDDRPGWWPRQRTRYHQLMPDRRPTPATLAPERAAPVPPTQQRAATRLPGLLTQARPPQPAQPAQPTPAAAQRPRAPRPPRSTVPPVLVEVRRGGTVESRHRGHVVQVGPDGAIERAIGDPNVVVALRSAAKPLGLVAFVEAGVADAFELSAPELAVLAASHSGEDLHVRTIQAILRRASISQTLLGCGSEHAPLDEVTAQRLAGDGERPGPIRHQCSGQHASFLLFAKHAGWPLEEYWRPEHPTQVAFRDALARVLGMRSARLVTSVDACGILTYHVPLVEVARAYLRLADPAGTAGDAAGRALVPALTRIRDAMLAAPDLVGGTRARFDTALMRTLPGLACAKGGAEGLQAIALLSRGAKGRSAAGFAAKIDDGDGTGRARPAVSVESLRQMGMLGEAELRRLAPYHRPPLRDPRGATAGEIVPVFELAPLSELR
jgi:L-asparaginase II